MDEKKKQAELERLRAYSCPVRDDRTEVPIGVLLSDQIRHYAHSFKLIDPFKDLNLKAAGYELSVGDEFVLGGKKQELGPDGSIRIPPFNVVVIKTAETINLPRFLIARWNLRVRWAYEGLLWVGAAQVDPGWVGHLFCPIYNLSDKVVEVRAGDSIALMDFVTTTPFKPNDSESYKRPPKRVLLEEYNAVYLKSGLTELAETKLSDFENKIRDTRGEVENRLSALQGRIDNFVSITFAVVGLLFAAVSLFFGKSEQPNWWDPSVFWISALAIIISIFAWVNSRSSVQWFRHVWQRMIFELFMFGLVVTTIVFFSLRTQSKVTELNGKVQALEGKINSTAAVPSAPILITPPVKKN